MLDRTDEKFCNNLRIRSKLEREIHERKNQRQMYATEEKDRPAKLHVREAGRPDGATFTVLCVRSTKCALLR